MGALARIWLATAALATGVVVGGRAHDPGWVAFLAGVAGAVALARRRSATGLVGLAVVALALGWTAASARAQRPTPLEDLAAGVERCEVQGVVTELAGGLGSLASVRRAECEGRAAILDAGTVVLDGEVASAGSSFSGTGWLLPLGDDSFGAARARLGAVAYLDLESAAFRPPRSGPLRLAHDIRAGLTRAAGSLEARPGGLLRGLAIGDTSGMDPELVESFRRAGLSHIVAVSGSNVAIVLGSIAYGLRSLSLQVRVTCGLSALVLFVLVVGPEPSVVRAAVMGAIGLVALAAGRRAAPLNALGLALLAVVGARPQMTHSVGLQLSAAATAGIVLWGHPLARLMRPLPRWLGVGLGATLGAQAAVAPLLVATFGELSVVAPAANLLAMPAVAPATVLGIAAAVGGAVHDGLGRLAARAADPFLRYIVAVSEHLGAPEWASLEITPRMWWTIAVPVVGCALVTLRRQHRR